MHERPGHFGRGAVLLKGKSPPLGRAAGMRLLCMTSTVLAAQRIAGADAAVADAEDLVLAVNIRDLVHKAVFLGAPQDLHDLFARCRARFVGLDGVGRHVTDGNAYVLFQMAAALIAHSAGPAAGAGADRILAVVLIQPVRQMLQIDRLLLRRDRLFDRDGTLAELTFHTDWMRYDCYVDLSGAALGIAVMLVLEALKRRVQKAPAH